MPISRRVMKFLIPLTIESLGRNDLTGRAIVPVYVNPESFSIQENKIISETLTKGGYSVQYWGEQLAEIQGAGSTGSAGVEEINILRSIYRNEINQFNNILLQRALLTDSTFRQALEDSSSSSVGLGFTSLLNEFTQNGFSGIIDGTKSAIEEITEAARGITDNNPSSVELIPTVGAFAVSMILYWQGEKFTGYFKNFRVDESAAKPGHFDYQFVFTVTKRSGIRTNFMPWHRSPYDASGAPISASTPSEGPRPEELSFQSNTQQTNFKQNPLEPGLNNSATSTFVESQSSEADINQVAINRNNALRGK